MTDDDFRDTVTRLADFVRDEIRGGTLFGHPIDPTDLDQVLVAAYEAGRRAPFKTRQEVQRR